MSDTVFSNRSEKLDFFTIFMFPFKYYYNGKKNTPSKIAQIITDKNKNWRRDPFEKASPPNYNEFYYFHRYVRKAIYDTVDEKSGHEVMAYLVRDDYKMLELRYAVEVEFHKNDEKVFRSETISAKVTSINLHLFDNQVGVLTIVTERNLSGGPISFNDILLYNDLARRIYPPYLGKKDSDWSAGDEYVEQILSHDSAAAVPKLSSKIFPIEVILSGEGCPSCDDFEGRDYKDEKGHLSSVIKDILSPFIFEPGLDESRADDKRLKEDSLFFSSFTDDRMFVVSYCSDDDISQAFCSKQRIRDNYHLSKDWYKFIFVDGGSAGIANQEMMEHLIMKHTYQRWVEDGTLYGLSRYSLVMVCDHADFSQTVLKSHMKSMYYQMALIMLFQKAMLLKFAFDVDEISKKFLDKKHRELIHEGSKLQGDFIKFVNQYWFAEVTPQEQGIEMYNKWREIMSLDELYENTSRAISDMAEYVDNEVEKETKRLLNTITKIGLPIAAATMLTEFLLLSKGYPQIWIPFLNVRINLLSLSSLPFVHFLFVVLVFSLFLFVVVMIFGWIGSLFARFCKRFKSVLSALFQNRK